ncbi:MBL fold metallo-hydrolase [Amycolatopsis nigrescens]|uniref:MBL fold metallo-hydrolase n=1 Tax=Amycolatopsis nigrescens TaxID=381445 RepID=UPI000380B9AB|nr:MBL fold metallo-hydrolase [Amycolatopsis nigrescens]
MRVHHLNCGTMRPAGGRLVDGEPGLLRRAEMICHCLLIETDSGLVLVDTGFGEQAARRPGAWLGKAFTTMVHAEPKAEETAAAQIAALGYRAEDLRDIVVTHLDIDHAGGLADFPEATVHVYAGEHRAATAPRNLAERQRYRRIQFEHGPRWQTYAEPGEPWHGFHAVRELKGVAPEILLIPLAGHTNGHAGVAVDTGDGWLLHAGDAYFFHGQLDPAGPHCTPVLSAFQVAMQQNSRARRENLAKLQELARNHGNDVRVFSAHNPVELRALQRS